MNATPPLHPGDDRTKQTSYSPVTPIQALHVGYCAHPVTVDNRDAMTVKD